MSEKALRVLDKAILYGMCRDGAKRPGVIIQALSQDDRDALKELTSDDTINQRVELKVRP